MHLAPEAPCYSYTTAALSIALQALQLGDRCLAMQAFGYNAGVFFRFVLVECLATGGMRGYRHNYYWASMDTPFISLENPSRFY